MDWDRSEMLALAKHGCAQCLGTGSVPARDGRQRPCNCVLRSIFRACYDRFRHCAQKEKYLSKVTLERVSGGRRRYNWSRKDEEYMADFILVSRRTLTQSEYSIFKFHFLLGADWRLCCNRLSVDRGTFYHSVYRIEQKLGLVFRELEPYGLFPLDEYFDESARRADGPPRKGPGRAEPILKARLEQAG